MVVFFIFIFQPGNFGVAVKGIFIKGHFGVQSNQTAVALHTNRIDFDHGGVIVNKSPVQPVDQRFQAGGASDRKF